MEIRKFLREIDTFSGLSDAELEKVAGLCRDRTYQKGEAVFSERDPGDRLFLIESGSIEIAKANASGAHSRIAILEHGEIFGELGVFEDRPRSAAAIATRETKVKVIEKKDLEVVLAADPALANRLLRGLLKKTGARLRLADEAIQTLIRSLDA